MTKFTEKLDKDGNLISITTSLTGDDLLQTTEINKGSSFSQEERAKFNLDGKLPDAIETLDQQVDRMYEQYKKIKNNLDKNNFLNQIKQYNETAFYRLVISHLEEMLPIVYTPTIGDAVMNYSFAFNNPCGLFLSYANQDKIEQSLNNISSDNIDIVLITDGEGVLGIGDWGVGGIDICIGKLMVYTLCAGIDPARVLPIQLDTGTNNQQLLDDPMYLGWRHKRISGSEYDEFVDKAITAIKKRFPDTYVHWEDFGRANARRVLDKYRSKFVSFNDDIQGTGATTTACILSALQAIKKPFEEQILVFFGAGSAGTGVAEQLYNALVMSGVDKEVARKQFWLIDRDGLICSDMSDLTKSQKMFARTEKDLKGKGLLDIVTAIKPTVLIGCSTVKGAFTEDIIKTMASNVERPIVFPLSNPTSLAEATPADIINWSCGKAIVATGSPFDPVEYNGKTIRISQCNNAFLFPGIGLGVLSSKATQVTDNMISAASHALSEWSPSLKDPSAPVLPSFDDVHEISRYVALKVAEAAKEDGVSSIDDSVDLKKHINSIFWEPKYYPYEQS